MMLRAVALRIEGNGVAMTKMSFIMESFALPWLQEQLNQSPK